MEQVGGRNDIILIVVVSIPNTAASRPFEARHYLIKFHALL